MTLHLIKVAVGAATTDDLQARQEHWHVADKNGRTVYRVRTRQTPKRAAELLNGGSLYWVIKGFVRARQDIWAFEPAVMDGQKYLLIHLDPTIIKTQLAPRGPHQGWRYLKPEDAPRDLPDGMDVPIDQMPMKMVKSLRELALL